MSAALLEGEIRFHTEPDGRLVLDQAPPVARITLQALQVFDQRLVRISGPLIRFANQATYLVTGWDPDAAALVMHRDLPPVPSDESAVTAPDSPGRPDWDGPVPHTTV